MTRGNVAYMQTATIYGLIRISTGKVDASEATPVLASVERSVQCYFESRIPPRGGNAIEGALHCLECRELRRTQLQGCVCLSVLIAQ